MHNLYLFQPQYSVEYRAEKNYWLPYSAGCLWSYAKQFQHITQHWQCSDIFFRRDSHEEILQAMENPTLCAFSCYQWNKTYCLELAKKIKQRWPNCVIGFGGPEVNVVFLENSFIDTIVLGEGEISFVEILETITNGNKPQAVYDKQRIQDLSTLPSPYATGVFDQLLQDNPGVKWATTLETNRGCPFSCTFCDWGSVTYSKVKKFPMERVKADIDWISKNPICYIFCADANFGIFKERDVEISRMIQQAAEKNQTLESFNATFNKNNNDWSFEILKVLGPLNRGFTVSVQSMNPATLRAIKRDNLEINNLKSIFEQCQTHQVNSYTELILGLPLETKHSFIAGLCELLELGQHNHIEIWFTDLLVNSALASQTDTLLYNIKTVDTSNYLALGSDSNDQYNEIIKLVKSTNTMSTNDMIESFLFGWLIVNFHMQGYSQIVARYLHHIHNISYLDFYTQLMESVRNCEILGPIFALVHDCIEELLNSGNLPAGLSGHNLVFCHGQSLYKYKNYIFKNLDLVCKQMGHLDVEQILTLQKAWIFDKETIYPMTLDSSFNLAENNTAPTKYIIKSKIVPDDLVNFDNFYYVLRRKGALKNHLTEVN